MLGEYSRPLFRCLSLPGDGKRYYRLIEEEPILKNPHTGNPSFPVRCKRAPVLFPGFRLLKSKFNRKTTAKHPMMRFSDVSDLKKMSSRPECMRYLEYLKEAGRWEANSDRPVMHFS